jgi:nicotinate-nucleotide adenylyltransferase
MIGILGGTFDPVHNGHLAVAEAARDALALDRVIFIPNACSPLKSSGPVASFKHRVAMLRLALTECDYCEISETEGHRGGTSFTIDTLRELTVQFPDASFYLIVGADALAEFQLWRDHEDILKLARLAYVERTDYPSRQSAQFPAHPIPMKRVDISSTMIRQRIRGTQSIDAFVPADVVKYIASHHLYGR